MVKRQQLEEKLTAQLKALATELTHQKQEIASLQETNNNRLQQWEQERGNIALELKSFFEMELTRVHNDYRQKFQGISNAILHNVQDEKVKLGEGAWGMVTKGTFGLAIKRLKNITPERYMLFKREIEVASTCHHPNIVQFIGARDHPECPLIFFELMAGTLRDFIKCYTPIEPEDTIRGLCLGTAQGLSYLHQKIPPVIHSDVKTDNILLKGVGNGWIAKISDLGTAERPSGNMTPNRGSIKYAAPEAKTTDQQSIKVSKS